MARGVDAAGLAPSVCWGRGLTTGNATAAIGTIVAHIVGPLSVELGHYDMIERLARCCSSYLEVGTYAGGSLRAAITGNPRLARVVCCDSWLMRMKEGHPRGHAHIEAILEAMGYEGAVEFLDGKSSEMLPGLVGPFDLTVVDADHSEAACYEDMRLVWPLTAVVMLVHDVWQHLEVRTAIWRFLRELPAGSARAALCAGDHGTLALFRAGGAP